MNDFISIGVLLTFIASIISIYYSRKNLKTSKYIDTVTSDRVIQMLKVREMAADIITRISNILDCYNYEIERKKEENETGEITLENWEEKMRSQQGIRKEIKFDTNVIDHTIEKLVRELYLLKLWIDEDKYVDLSDTINNFIAFFKNQSCFILKEETQNQETNLISFIKEIHDYTKTEYQIIFKELDGKSNETEIKWGVLGYPLFYIYKIIKWLIIRS